MMWCCTVSAAAGHWSAAAVLHDERTLPDWLHTGKQVVTHFEQWCRESWDRVRRGQSGGTGWGCDGQGGGGGKGGGGVGRVGWGKGGQAFIAMTAISNIFRCTMSGPFLTGYTQVSKWSQQG